MKGLLVYNYMDVDACVLHEVKKKNCQGFINGKILRVFYIYSIYIYIIYAIYNIYIYITYNIYMLYICIIYAIYNTYHMYKLEKFSQC